MTKLIFLSTAGLLWALLVPMAPGTCMNGDAGGTARNQPGSTTTYTVEIQAKPANDACSTIINVARTARLDVLVPVISPSSSIEQDAQKKLTASVEGIKPAESEKKAMNLRGGDDSGAPSPAPALCDQAIKQLRTEGAFLVEQKPAEKPSKAGDHLSCPNLIANEVKTGASEFKDYSNQSFSEEYYNTGKKKNMARLLSQHNSAFGCVTALCTVKQIVAPSQPNGASGGEGHKGKSEGESKIVQETSFLYCAFNPDLNKSDVPFSKEYIDGVKARANDANIDLASMTETDIKRPTISSSPSFAATLSILTLCLGILL